MARPFTGTLTRFRCDRRRTRQSGTPPGSSSITESMLSTRLSNVLLFAGSQNMGQSWKTVATVFASLLTFYVQTWDEYHTKTLTLGIVNGPVEGILILVAVYSFTGYVGGRISGSKAPSLPSAFPKTLGSVLGLPDFIYELSFTEWYHGTKARWFWCSTRSSRRAT